MLEIERRLIDHARNVAPLETAKIQILGRPASQRDLQNLQKVGKIPAFYLICQAAHEIAQRLALAAAHNLAVGRQNPLHQRRPRARHADHKDRPIAFRATLPDTAQRRGAQELAKHLKLCFYLLGTVHQTLLRLRRRLGRIGILKSGERRRPLAAALEKMAECEPAVGERPLRQSALRQHGLEVFKLLAVQ